MNAHVRSSEEGSAMHVERLFDRMTRLGREHSNPDMLPDKVSYTTLMKAWMKDQEPGYAASVEKLLRQMTDAYEQDGIAALKPDVISYGCAIDAWSRSGESDAIFRAERLIREMERLAEKGDANLRPNSFCFNSIINAHSKAGNAEQAESVLRWMQESYQGGNRSVKPNAISYTSCIDAWARCTSTEQDCVRRSQQLFATLVDKYKEDDPDCKPTAATLAALMTVLAHHKSSDVARIANENLQVIADLDIEPNAIAYNALLHACSCASADKSEALKLAITSFHTMKSKRIPVSSVTYKSLLNAVNNLVEGEDARQRALEDVFRKCQEDDKVNDTIMSTMKRFGLPTSFKHLMNRKESSDNDSDKTQN